MLQNLTNGGMEICWLYAISVFLINIFMKRDYFFIFALVSFIISAVLTASLARQGWRVIYKLLLKLFGYCFIALLVIYAHFYRQNPFFSIKWITDFFTAQHSIKDWLTILSFLLVTLFLWISGALSAKREKTYFKICARFDIGLAAFFCIFLGKFVLTVKSEAAINEAMSFSILFPFLLFGFISIALSKDETKANKEFLPGYSGIGLLTGFSVVILLFAACIIILIPVLTMAADMSYQALKSGSGFLPFIFNLIRIIITPGTVSESPDGGALNLPQANYTHGWLSDLLETFVSYGIMGVVFLVAILVIAILIIFAGRWVLIKIIQWLSTLLRRKHFPRENLRQSKWTFHILIFFGYALLYFYNILMHGFRKCRNAADHYQMLIKWGRVSGIIHSKNETALEYGAKLNRYFPHLKEQIDYIIYFFIIETYGGLNSSESISQARVALRTLRKMRYLPLRLKIYTKCLSEVSDV